MVNNLSEYKKTLPKDVFEVLVKEKIESLRPCQVTALKKGVMDYKSLLVCTPTASGKTLIGEIAALNAISSGRGKAVYIVPLKALANEKYKEFKKRYGHKVRIALSIGNLDQKEDYLANFDLIIATAEKLDSLLRHHCPWIKYLKVIIVDEIHLMNDVGRGPTLEILITLLRKMVKNLQIIGLSATIGNPKELAEWLDADLIYDEWRPVILKKGLYLDGTVTFEKQKK